MDSMGKKKKSDTMEKFLYDPVMYAKPATYLRDTLQSETKKMYMIDWLKQSTGITSSRHTLKEPLSHTHTPSIRRHTNGKSCSNSSVCKWDKSSN